jgi:hypothetical protein
VGEDGRLYLMTKSEHYHAPLGHAFPGYTLIEKARALGIPNATHNNTRGFITRRLEEELVRTANGLAREDAAGLSDLLARKDDLYLVNRVLNLETGSLAVEAALKMILARFIRMQPDMQPPPYEGRIPVILVMGNDDGGLQANYHGTTVLTQMLRGMWPGLHAAMEEARMWKVVPIRPNCQEDVDAAFAAYDSGAYKDRGVLPRDRDDELRRTVADARVSDTRAPTLSGERCGHGGGRDPVLHVGAAAFHVPRIRADALLRGDRQGLPRRRVSGLAHPLQSGLGRDAAVRGTRDKRSGRTGGAGVSGDHGVGAGQRGVNRRVGAAL